MPRQIWYLIWSEACERFSFYGMKNVLTAFLVGYLLETKQAAEANYHLFVSACYFFPLLGGWLADRYFGKYRTIFWLSLLYCAGHTCLALFDDHRGGFYTGLGLIALGAGGIKPCVATLVGDQFDTRNAVLAPRVFAWFYWIVNFGSFFASLLIPKTLEWFGPKVAFGIPGVLMAIATFILWLGRRRYVEVPLRGRSPDGFWRVLWTALRNRRRGVAFWEGARAHHPAAALDAARSVLGVLLVYLPIPFFWALFDQKGSTWIIQAREMNLDVLGVTLAPSQILALNPILVMLLIPLFEYWVYPALARRGTPLTPLRRMTLGMFFSGAAFVLVALIQMAMEGGARPSILWQAAPYVVLTIGEVLVSTTGLAFAYSQAPPEMKSTLMSLWNLTVTIGNLLTALIAGLNVFSGSRMFFFFAGLITVAGFAFWFLSRRYKPVDRYRTVEQS